MDQTSSPPTLLLFLVGAFLFFHAPTSLLWGLLLGVLLAALARLCLAANLRTGGFPLLPRMLQRRRVGGEGAGFDAAGGAERGGLFGLLSGLSGGGAAGPSNVMTRAALLRLHLPLLGREITEADHELLLALDAAEAGAGQPRGHQGQGQGLSAQQIELLPTITISEARGAAAGEAAPEDAALCAICLEPEAVGAAATGSASGAPLIASRILG